MKNRKRIALLVMSLITCLMLAFAGCTGSSPEASTDAESLNAHDFEASESEEATEVSEEVAEEESVEGDLPSSAVISNFPVLSQYPELPNGCEITTLAAVLNYEGIAVSKTTLSDDFLPKAPVGQANFYREFVGNPRDNDAYGCYAPVIAATAQSYLSSINSSLSVQNLTGSAFDDLYHYVAQGTPVIVWATQYNQQGHYSVTWYVDGQSLTWFTPEHCMALVGYDLNAGTVTVADPMQGSLVDFDLATFISNYNDLGQQAVVIS